MLLLYDTMLPPEAERPVPLFVIWFPVILIVPPVPAISPVVL
jgi:hypothetical protein